MRQCQKTHRKNGKPVTKREEETQQAAERSWIVSGSTKHISGPGLVQNSGDLASRRCRPSLLLLACVLETCHFKGGSVLHFSFGLAVPPTCESVDVLRESARSHRPLFFVENKGVICTDCTRVYWFLNHVCSLKGLRNDMPEV